MSILVVDDSNVSRLLLQRLLERGGFGPTIGAVSAEESYAILGLDGGEARTDVELVLMDVELPGVRGYEACRRLRAEDRLRHVPVLMVTANLGPEHVQEAFNSGARDYIGKPVQEVELLARVGAALALKREMDVRREREHELLVLKRQLEEANAGLQRLSTEDALTGLANRRAFDQRLSIEWQRACDAESEVSVLLLDVDQFKDYNDRFGHPKGDILLKHIAHALANCVHRPADLVARYGGEEFVALLPATPCSGALLLGEKMRLAVERLGAPRGSHQPTGPVVTISIGAATVRASKGTNPTEIVAFADAALYRAKASGRNQVQRAEPAPRLLAETA
jgi:diguanylate cyclase (GGDEF)-like protein